MHKKSAFSLIELSIALVLIGIICTTLFRFFSQVVIYHERLENTKSEILEHAHMQTRLNQIFSQIPSSFDPSHCSLFTKIRDQTTILFFIFNNDFDPDPAFSGLVKGKLYKKDDKLCLLISPLEENEKTNRSREEILASNVQEISYFFYQKEEKKKWIKKWTKKENLTPSMIRIELKKITDPKETIAFSFSLPSFQQYVILGKAP